MPRDPERLGSTATGASERLRGKDSNLEFQGQNLASCHYSTPQRAMHRS